MIEINVDNKKISNFAINSLNIKTKLNEHSRLDIIIKSIDNFNIKSKDIELINQNIVIFCGRITKIKIHNLKDNEKIIEINAVSNSYEMDILKNNRVFQDVDITYKNIVEYIMKKYKLKYILSEKLNSNINKMYVQYFESDFEFLKRILNDIKQYIFTSYKGIISFGNNKVNEINDENIIEYYQEYNNDKISETKIAKSQNYLAGDRKNSKILSQSDIYLKNNNIFCKYRLEDIENIKYKYICNIKGAFLNAKVISIHNIDNIAKMKVKFLDFEDNSKNQVYIPFSTPYSKNMTGMYVAPFNDDKVDVYFRSNNDSDCAVAFCINNENSSRFLDMNKRNYNTNEYTWQIDNQSCNIMANIFNIHAKNGFNIASQKNVLVESKDDTDIYASKLEFNAKINDIDFVSNKNINFRADKINNN